MWTSFPRRIKLAWQRTYSPTSEVRLWGPTISGKNSQMPSNTPGELSLRVPALAMSQSQGSSLSLAARASAQMS